MNINSEYQATAASHIGKLVLEVCRLETLYNAAMQRLDELERGSTTQTNHEPAQGDQPVQS